MLPAPTLHIICILYFKYAYKASTFISTINDQIEQKKISKIFDTCNYGNNPCYTHYLMELLIF